MNFKSSQSYSYTANYCEENIWKLAAHPDFAPHLDRCHILFISNAHKQCPIWHQRASLIHGDPVLWDYHVVLIHDLDQPELTLVWDLDTLLATPSPFDTWWESSFLVTDRLAQIYRPCFRLVPAKLFLEMFSSDRRHMQNQDGTWRMFQPPWAPIHDGHTHNLPSFVDMTTPSSYGELFDAHRLLKRFSADLLLHT